MFKLKFKQKMKPNFLLCLTLRRKNPTIEINILSKNFLSVFSSFKLFNNLEFGKAGIKEKLANKKPVAVEDRLKIPDIKSA